MAQSRITLKYFDEVTNIEKVYYDFEVKCSGLKSSPPIGPTVPNRSETPHQSSQIGFCQTNVKPILGASLGHFCDWSKLFKRLLLVLLSECLTHSTLHIKENTYVCIRIWEYQFRIIRVAILTVNIYSGYGHGIKNTSK